MKKIMSFVSLVFVAIFVFVLSACGNSNASGITESDIICKETVTYNSVTLNYTFTENDNIKKGLAKFTVKQYQIDKIEDTTGTYKNYKDVSFSNSVYTSSSVSFTNLSSETNYMFILIMTFNGDEKEMLTTKVTTPKEGSSSEVSKSIKNVEDFKAMENSNEGYFELANDIDFENNEVSVFTSKTFKGTFDGKGHTLKNIKLSNSSNAGLFGSTDSAIIKNVKLENVNGTYTSKGDIKLGALIGNALKTTVSDVFIDNVKLTITSSSTAKQFIGGVFGYAEACSLTDIEANNVTIEATQSRLQVEIGLFAGKICGEAISEDNIFVNKCSAEGNIKCGLYFSSTASTNEAYVYVGGFVGNVDTNSLITDSYDVSQIEVSQYASKKRDFNLYVGGFVGANSGKMNILSCLAVTEIEAFAGTLPDDLTNKSYTDVLLATESYISGFIGYAKNPFYRIESSVVCYTKDTLIDALVSEDTYELTIDEVALDGKDYYKLENNEYVLATLTAGDTLLDDYYELTSTNKVLYNDSNVYGYATADAITRISVTTNKDTIDDSKLSDYLKEVLQLYI